MRAHPSTLTSVSRSAYDLILDWIYEHSVPPGTKLSERGVVEELGLSRMPVREAMKRLSLEGLLVQVPGRGTCLRTYNEQDILDLYAYREVLDGMATRLFTLRADTNEVHYVRMLCEGMEVLSREYDAREWDEKDYDFHTTIARGCRNARILTALETVLRECMYLWKQYRFAHGYNDPKVPPSYLPDVLGEHQQIVDAIAGGDPDHAEKVARKSVQDGVARRVRRLVKRTRPLGPKP